MRALSDLRISLLAAAAATALGSPADAQPNAPAPAPQAQPDDEVVIVTARRRAEDVQSVPVAVSAIPLEMIEATGTTARIKPEAGTTYELGLKTRFFERTLTANLAVFYTAVNDY